jgi:predicted phosphodiesterase
MSAAEPVKEAPFDHVYISARAVSPSPSDSHQAQKEPRKTVRIVCISDTHTHHAEIRLPPGDVLVHAGDFTRFGALEHAEEFDRWLGEQPFAHRLVVSGNHEQNADWFKSGHPVLRNATVLRDESVQVAGLSFYGCDFAWPSRFLSGPGSRYHAIPTGTDVLIVHGPAHGYLDHVGQREGHAGAGCPDLRYEVARAKPRLLVCGHIHSAHGVQQGTDEHSATCFVNAAMCRDGYHVGWNPIVVTVELQ